jgi:hypothetical protein
MNATGKPHLDDASFLEVIGQDTGPSTAVGTESEPTRIASINNSTLTKVMQRRFINRSTSLCANAMPVSSNAVVILMDIFFKLVHPKTPADYNLNLPGYSFDTPNFIAQFLTAQNGQAHFGNLLDPNKEIAVVVIRTGNGGEYQPYDMKTCGNGINVNPVTVDGSDINFISNTKLNGLLSGTFSGVQIKKSSANKAILAWDYISNESVKNFEIERAQADGKFEKVISIPSEPLLPGTSSYQYSDLLLTATGKQIFRIKAILHDGAVEISPMVIMNHVSSAATIYPNPAKTSLQVQLPAGFTNAQYRIFSASGKHIKNVQKSGNINRLDINDLQSGLYFIEIVDLVTAERITSSFQKD